MRHAARLTATRGFNLFTLRQRLREGQEGSSHYVDDRLRFK